MTSNTNTRMRICVFQWKMVLRYEVKTYRIKERFFYDISLPATHF